MPWATCRPMGARPAGCQASSASWSTTACCPRSSSIRHAGSATRRRGNWRRCGRLARSCARPRLAAGSVSSRSCGGTRSATRSSTPESLRITPGEALRELNRSLAAYEKRGEVQRLKNAIGSIPPDDLAERPCDDRLITRGRYERMAERLRKLQKQRGMQAEIAALSGELTAWPCATCPVEQRCLATLEALRARELRRSSLRQALHSLEGALADEFTRRAAVLRRLGYLDENSRLTPEGLWASELRHPRMLVLAEIVRRSLIGGSTAAWAAVAGALATERAPYRGGEAGLGALIKLARELDVLERQHALPPDGLVQQCEPEWDPQSRRRLPPPAERRADVVMAWMRAADWSALVAESHAEEGDLQRIILQAAEVMMQIEGLPFSEVRTAARDARLRLLRSPVV